MYVAKSRQVPPENAFSRRRKAQAELEAREAAKRMPEPAVVADQMPDLDALREAASRAAALVHGPVAESAPDPEPEPEGMELTSLTAVKPSDVTEESKRGRPKSSAAEERANRVLELVTQAGSAGTTKASLVQATGENPPNVNTSLQRLKDEGKIDSKPVEGSKALAWFAV
jgi:hypothetical protein